MSLFYVVLTASPDFIIFLNHMKAIPVQNLSFRRGWAYKSTTDKSRNIVLSQFSINLL